MKIVINACYGGFSLSKSAAAYMGTSTHPWDEDIRTDPRLVDMVERDALAASGDCAELTVVEIPDNATDWEMSDYDGIESIIYVVDGKIHHA